jgi:hypothetical protein
MDQEILFGGFGISRFGAGSSTAALPRNEEEFQRLYADKLAARPTWVKVLQAKADRLRATPDGRATYGEPTRGATLPQAWRMHFAMTDHFKVCLLARGRASTPTDGIPKVVLIAPSDLTSALARGFAEVEDFSAQLFVYDGRAGHSVRAQGHDPAAGTFLYHDPWPGRSLLCREFNNAGVDAQPAENGLWQIRDQDLAQVIFAAFVMPTDWAQLSGLAYRVSYAALQQSDFWKFFNLREAARHEAGKHVAVFLQPGSFQKELNMRLDLNRTGHVRRGFLELRRSWVVGQAQGINPFAADIAKSFVGILLPEPDRAAGACFVQALARVGAPSVVKALVPRREAANLSAVEQLQLTYLGLAAGCTELLIFCRIEAKNTDEGGDKWLSLEMDLY